jgi:hypothetical protein
MAELETIANIAEIFGALTVIGGVFFAAIQIRQYRQQRRDAAAIELVHSFRNPELARAFQLIRVLPDGVSAAQLRGDDSQLEEAAGTIGMTFETMGLLAFRHVAPFAVVYELTGDSVVFFWKKLSLWVEEARAEQAQESVFEWFQWLAERSQECDDPDMVQPAYKRFRTWRPRA